MLENSDTPSKSRRAFRRLRVVGLVSILSLLMIEVFARFGFDLGTPPLSIAHPKIEYMFAPNQNVYRFGNHFQTNSWSMRSPAFPARKLDPDEFRIMVFGDSVLNGGNLTDHAELATTIISQKLSREFHRPVIVGNISAGSWGPGNWRAYAEEFGFFDADCVILVINSRDDSDCPTFEPLDPNTHPTERPWFATSELLFRYLPRYLPSLGDSNSNASESEADIEASESRRIEVGLQDLQQFLEMAKASAPHIVVVQYLDRQEIVEGTELPGFARIRSLCDELQIDAYSTRSNFPADEADQLFRDEIHPTRLGQQQLAEVLLEKLPSSMRTLESSSQ